MVQMMAVLRVALGSTSTSMFAIHCRLVATVSSMYMFGSRGWGEAGEGRGQRRDKVNGLWVNPIYFPVTK